MWTLECDGDSLAHKKLWLRPGKRYLFGRTKEPKGRDVGFKIDHRSVSRQHLTLSISSVKPGHGSNVEDRSEITAKDENTKFRTEVDGDKIKGEARILANDKHVFRLGNSDQTFHLRWEPVVFTVSLSTKELNSEDPLAKYRNRLEDLDIKVIHNYIIGSTTHVVATKRNTAKGLQALIHAKYVVTDSFIDALVYATTPTNLDEDESLSPLEEDFTANWPNPFEHLPAKSKEPSERPPEDYRPNSQRISVFEDYTFVFCDPTQFGQLHAPITNGGGKAVEFKVENGRTTTEDIVRYVKSIAGEKGLGEFEDGSEGKGVVVVKFRGKGDLEDWAARLDRDVAQALDHRLIEQSEFLEAILANDASMLRRPLLPNDGESFATNQSATTQNGAHRPNGHAKEEPRNPPQKRVQPRTKIVSRFKGFDSDDDDDEEETSVPTSSRQATHKSQVDSMPSNSNPQRNSNRTYLSDEDSMVIDSQSQVNGHTQPHTQTQNARKRPAPPSSDEDDAEDLIDKILPAAAALKRRRIELEADSGQNGISSRESFMSQGQPKTEKKTKAVKAVNIKDVVRERRKAEEETARQEEESLKDTVVDGMSAQEMGKLAVVEEMDLPERRTDNRKPDNENGVHWDERWNGRKNFKKFRRRGENDQARRGQSVIVPLEEVKKKDFGIGEDYWLERDSEKSKSKQKRKDGSLQADSQHTPFTTARSQPVEVPSELLIDDGGESSHPVDVDAPRRTRHQEQTHEIEEDTMGSQIVNGRKRPAPGPTPGRPLGPKKRKKFAAAQDSDSDD